jgi:DNA-binding transcriptional ArsR family regulator
MKETALLPDLVAAQANEAAAVMRMLSHAGRLRVLCHLVSDGEVSAGELTRRIGLSQSALSQHLARMREEGLVVARKDGLSVHYRVADLKIKRLLGALQDIYCTALAKGGEGEP